MGEENQEIAFKNGWISDFQGFVTLTLNRVILHTIMHHSSTSTYIPNLIEIEETFCGWTDGRTDGHLRLTALGRLGGVNLKMKTRHPIENSIGSEFRAICNHCIFLAAGSRKTLKLCEKFLQFFGKTTPYGKFLKILFQTFSSWHRSTLYSNFVKFGRWEISEIVRHFLKKKQNFACLSNCRYCTDRAENLPRNVLSVLQTSSKSVHVQHSYCKMREHCQIKVQWFQYLAEAYLWAK